MDSGQLRTLSSALRSKAGEFTRTGNDIQQSTDHLTAQTTGLTVGTERWAGNASLAFQAAWQELQARRKNAVVILNDIAGVFNKLANSLDDAANQYDTAMAQMLAMTAATVGLTILDIMQLGLDPLTDAATVGAGGDAVLLEEQATMEIEQAALEADQIAATEFEQLSTQVTDEMVSDLELTEDDVTTAFARNNSNVFKNPINMSRVSTPENMPSGVNNPIGQNWIKQIQDSGVRVEWNLDAQLETEKSQALGFTSNFNAGQTNPSSDLVVVALSPDAANATMYEEYLHVQNALARGWVPNGSQMANLTEEIQVEFAHVWQACVPSSC